MCIGLYILIWYVQCWCVSSKSSVDKMEDLDSLFEGEMASINEMFQEFEIKDKQNKKRQELEQEDLKKKVGMAQSGGCGSEW